MYTIEKRKPMHIITFFYCSSSFVEYKTSTTTRRDRRTAFEAFMLNERKKMETFRMRETKEFLTIDELKEKCETANQHMELLEVCFIIFI